MTTATQQQTQFSTIPESDSEPCPRCDDGIITMPMSSGNFVLFHREDFGLVSPYHWYQSRHPRGPYAVADVSQKKRRRHFRMHRLILDAPTGVIVDHVNRNGLDNRRCNLRLCTNAQNQCNRGRPKNNTSLYKGVSFCRSTGRWSVKIQNLGEYIWIGRFETPEEAAWAYDDAAREHFGEYAYLNFPEVQG